MHLLVYVHRKKLIVEEPLSAKSHKIQHRYIFSQVRSSEGALFYTQILQFYQTCLRSSYHQNQILSFSLVYSERH